MSSKPTEETEMETQVTELNASQIAALDVIAANMPPAVTVGRTVNYVLADGQVRPLNVTRVRGDMLGHVNGVLFFDGSNDALLLPRPRSGPIGEPCKYLAAIPYDANKNPRTWHLPETV
jgi:hypothetical protein